MADGTAPSSPRKARSKKRRRTGAKARPGDGAAKKKYQDKLYGAIDLGTNNCRLLIAAPNEHGFRVVDGHSQIIRLGEGLEKTGILSDEAMDRTIHALKICAGKINRRKIKRLRCVATQACRVAKNGKNFLNRIKEETGLRLEIISTDQEARFAVRGCQDLLDEHCAAALVIDVGGGSTELCWLDLGPDENGVKRPGGLIRATTSLNLGVVTMADRFPETEDRNAWFDSMRSFAREHILRFEGAHMFRPAFDEGNVHYIGTSGAVTSLGGLHLNLPRYNRARVDGLWLSRTDTETATARLLSQTLQMRAQEPCIGKDRADLVLAGCAILAAVQDVWPAPRVRVADRGLRDGLLLGMMASDRRHGRQRGQKGHNNKAGGGRHSAGSGA